MQWNCLFIIFKKMDVTVSKRNFRDSSTESQIRIIEKAIKDFAGLVSKNTGNKVNISDKIMYIDNLQYMTNNKGASSSVVSPIVSPDDLTNAVSTQIPGWNLGFNEYDSVFAVFPGSIFETSLNCYLAHLSYYVSMVKGATYHSMIANLSKKTGLALEDYNGEAFLHEWLHGVCYFFEGYDWPMPKRQSDGAGVYNYKEFTNGKWNEFYKDIMNGKVHDKNNSSAIKDIGIPVDKWAAAKPSALNDFIGLGSMEKDSFKKAYGTLKGTIIQYVHGSQEVKKVRTLKNVEIQNFTGPDGDFAVMRKAVSEHYEAYVVPNNIWVLFNEKKLDLFPVNNMHRWANGNIQDFETIDGWHAGIMQKAGEKSLFLVKGLIWKAYIGKDGNGAESYLGYPKGEEFVWTSPDSGEKYFVQFFEGGYCWAMTKSPWKYGKNIHWGDQKGPVF